MIDRRSFLGTVAVGVVAVPAAALAQPAMKVWRVGLLDYAGLIPPARPGGRPFANGCGSWDTRRDRASSSSRGGATAKWADCCGIGASV